jgi:16S rRNA (cytosine1402-N4)-methyltransferase
MKYAHKPVLAKETLQGLNVKPDGIYADGTLGGGGHAALICEKLSNKGLLIGIDRDREALQQAAETLKPYPCGKLFVHANYGEIKRILAENGIAELNGALLDLGVSSYQLDNPERGFSYMQDAPLDMRMDAGDVPGLTAREIVNEYSERELTEIIRAYGEERWASRIAKFIVKARSEQPVETTGRLTEIIKAAIPASARREGPHPAKRTYQALRIETNNELAPLGQSIDDFISVLARKGRMAVISFHSLEDRIVKETYRKREDPCVCPPGLTECLCGKVADARRVNRKPITADAAELEENPRARSAKLRVLEKM